MTTGKGAMQKLSDMNLLPKNCHGVTVSLDITEVCQINYHCYLDAELLPLIYDSMLAADAELKAMQANMKAARKASMKAAEDGNVSG